MRKIYFVLPLLALQLIFISCARQPVARLQVVGNPTEWNYGRSIVSQSSDDVQIKISFEASTENHLVFNIEVANNSDISILVNPISAYLSDSQGNILQRAIDPEAMLLREDIRKAAKVAQERGNATMGAVLATGSAIAAIAGEDVYYSGTELNTYNNNRDYRNSIVVQPSYWSDETLRKTNLYPNHLIQGRLLFKRLNEQSNFNLNFVVNKTIFIVNYNQILH